ncbi:RICIN domain-containing protein, partial [Streptomyces sp. NPDC089915]|uniref:RICIN domain-containing protein n=1 Tax=Streptomyces sp. NPDC089915 TaxID=3155186 RepID=UPI00344AB351
MSQIRVPSCVAAAVVLACLVAAFLPVRPHSAERTGATIGSAAAVVPLKVGGPVTRAQVIRRARSWVDQKVPYSQQGYWPEKATGRTWRTDCSGFVSMAWMLPASENTDSLPSRAKEISTSELRPGDILNSVGEGHVVLFDDWIDKAKGTFSFYQESNKDVPTNRSTGSLKAAKIAGIHTSTYKALRYTHIVEDDPAPEATPKPKAPQPTPTPKPTPKAPTPTPVPVVGGGLRTWVNASTRMCLEIRRSAGEDGATANQWTCNNSSSQKWTTTNPAGGPTTVVHMDSRKCLEIRGDSVADGATA